MDKENENVEKAEEMRVFMINILTDLTVLKNNIYNNQVFEAYRNVQKTSDKIKDKIGKL